MEVDMRVAVATPARSRTRRHLSLFWKLFRRAWYRAYKDNCFGLAKAAAYSALLGLFPFLTTLAAILVQINAAAIAESLSELLYEALPAGTETLVVARLVVEGQRPAALLVLATLLSLWAASGLMVTLMQGFEVAYRVRETRSFWHQRLVAVLLVLATALPVITASALLLFGNRFEQGLMKVLGVLPEGQQLEGSVRILGQLMRYLIVVAALVAAASSLYYYGPHRKRQWRLVWPGSVLATALGFLTTVGFSWYVQNVAHYNVMYGSVGVVIALLVWMYLLSIIALFGCEFNALRERKLRLTTH